MTKITVKAEVNAEIEQVWEFYNTPEHVTKWNNASPDWHTPSASNDLSVGGKFNYRMEAKDGSAGFDFEGIYDEVVNNHKIKYHLGDDRSVEVIFEELSEDLVEITVTFDAEGENDPEYQKQGWQSILDNFKKYAEENK
jgi:uncharacterized protein YndB with AHSA1/START domain